MTADVPRASMPPLGAWREGSGARVPILERLRGQRLAGTPWGRGSRRGAPRPQLRRAVPESLRPGTRPTAAARSLPALALASRRAFARPPGSAATRGRWPALETPLPRKRGCLDGTWPGSQATSPGQTGWPGSRGAAPVPPTEAGLRPKGPPRSGRTPSSLGDPRGWGGPPHLPQAPPPAPVRSASGSHAHAASPAVVPTEQTWSPSPPHLPRARLQAEPRGPSLGAPPAQGRCGVGGGRPRPVRAPRAPGGAGAARWT